MRLRRVLLATTAVLALHVAPAHAVQCGDTIGPGQVVVLDADLTCGGLFGAAALTLNGGTLDLNGHTLTCSCSLECIGVQVTGEKSVLRDSGTTPGAITNCYYHVLIQASKTKVRNIRTIATFWSGEHNTGFFVAPGAEKTTLLDNVAFGSGLSTGFDIRGDRTIALRNETNHADVGFTVSSNNNILRDNLASVCFQHASGFEVSGANNQIRRNTALGDCVQRPGVGFAINGASHTVSRNTTTGAGIGIWLRSGGDHTVKRNTVTENFVGLRVGDFGRLSTNNDIRRNTATGNVLIDLQDLSGDCSSNTWRKNRFGSAYPSCIE